MVIEPHPGQDDTRADAAPITPAVFHILLVLTDGAAHGYGIMQDVERLTEGRTRLGAGTMYRSLQRMEVDGLVEEVSLQRADADDDERRRYYRLTGAGRRAAHAEAERLATLVRICQSRGLLGGQGRS